MTATQTRAGVGLHGALGLATALPMLVVLTAGAAGATTDRGLLLGFVLIFGVSHVGTTAAFYVDREMRPVLAANPARYYLWPVVLAGVGVLVMASGWRPAIVAVVAVHAFWTVHHFTRQNLGVFAFANKSAGAGGPTALERRMIDLTGYAGMLGVASMVTPLGFSIPASSVLASCGVLVLGAAVAHGWVAAREAHDPQRTVGIVLLVAFYSPLFVLRDRPLIAAAAYSAAHVAQYYVMMLHLRSGRDAAGERRMVRAVAWSWLLIGFPVALAARVDLPSPVRWMFGLHLGIVCAHFVIDAGAWKLAQPEQRAYMRRRFEFL